MKQQPWDAVQQRFTEITKTLPDLLGSQGDVLLFGGGKKGEAADMFNKMAEGIALMSFLPGGVRVFGVHWDTTHPDTLED